MKHSPSNITNGSQNQPNQLNQSNQNAQQVPRSPDTSASAYPASISTPSGTNAQQFATVYHCATSSITNFEHSMEIHSPSATNIQWPIIGSSSSSSDFAGHQLALPPAGINSPLGPMSQFGAGGQLPANQNQVSPLAQASSSSSSSGTAERQIVPSHITLLVNLDMDEAQAPANSIVRSGNTCKDRFFSAIKCCCTPISYGIGMLLKASCQFFRITACDDNIDYLMDASVAAAQAAISAHEVHRADEEHKSPESEDSGINKVADGTRAGVVTVFELARNAGKIALHTVVTNPRDQMAVNFGVDAIVNTAERIGIGAINHVQDGAVALAEHVRSNGDVMATAAHDIGRLASITITEAEAEIAHGVGMRVSAVHAVGEAFTSTLERMEGAIESDISAGVSLATSPVQTGARQISVPNSQPQTPLNLPRLLGSVVVLIAGEVENGELGLRLLLHTTPILSLRGSVGITPEIPVRNSLALENSNPDLFNRPRILGRESSENDDQVPAFVPTIPNSDGLSITLLIAQAIPEHDENAATPSPTPADPSQEDLQPRGFITNLYEFIQTVVSSPIRLLSAMEESTIRVVSPRFSIEAASPSNVAIHIEDEEMYNNLPSWPVHAAYLSSSSASASSTSTSASSSSLSASSGSASASSNSALILVPASLNSQNASQLSYSSNDAPPYYYDAEPELQASILASLGTFYMGSGHAHTF